MAISPSLGFIVVLLSCIAILPHFSSAQGSCRTRCGEDYYRGYACHCDYNCLLHKECCPDYEGLCTTANSCKGRCGEDFQRGRKCNCDAGCLEFNQCCSDYQSHCLKETPKTTVAKPTTVPITTRANTPQVQATKKLAVNLSPLIQKPVPTTQSATTASSRFQAIETTASDSSSANEEMIQDLSESQLITLSTLPPVNQPTSRPAVTTMQLENLKYPEFQRDDETVLLELTEAMPYQEQFLPSFTHSFSTEPSAPSSVFSILQSTTEASTKPEEHANPTEPLVLESDTIRPAVTEQTTPSAAVNDQEPETPSESDTTGPAVTEQTTPSAAVNDQESETPSESDTTGPAVTEQTTPSAAVNDQEPETPSESDTARPAVTEQTTPSAAVNDQEPETPSESDTTGPAVTEQTTTPSAAVNDQESETPSESDTTGPAVTEQTTTPSAAVNDQEPETPSESDTARPAVTEQTTPSAALNDQEPETLSESNTARPAVTEQTTPSAAVNDQESETPSESDTARPAVTEQTTPSAAVNDQEPDTPSESGFEPSMTDAPETDTPSPPEGDVPSASPTQTPASTSTLSLTITTPTNNPSDIFLPEFMTTVSNLEDSTSLPPYSTESSTPLIAFFTPKSTTGASEKPEEKANPTEPQASESSTTRPDIAVLASIAAIDNVAELSMTELQTPRGALATPPGAENIPEPAVPTGTESVSPTNGAPSSASPTKIPTIMSTPSSTTTDPTRNVLLADDNDDDNLCSGRPVNGITTLLNGTMYAFRGHWFWMLNSYGIEVGYPRRITDVWGIPSPIDSVFTRCNCQGKTFFFKGSNYWRFENGGMDPGYPKLISKGFGGIKGQITAALSVSSSWRRPESVYFFKQGGLVQKYSYTQKPPQTCKKMQTQYSVYSIRNRFARQLSSQSKDTVTLGQEINIKLQWRGFPTSVTSAISVPNARKPDGYDYFVFSRTRYYNINILADQPTVTSPSPSSERQRSTAKDWFKCP